MEEASQFSADHTSKAQAGYVSRYNLRAHPKQFFEGDQVVVFAPGAGGKLCNKWQGPGTIQEVRSANSYLVNVGEGGTRHVHANKIRRFVARVSGCSVVNECDSDFGRIVTQANVVMSVNVSARIEEDKLSHLDNQQLGELLQLLDEFSDRFVDKPGLCEAVVHHIQTTADFVPPGVLFDTTQ